MRKAILASVPAVIMTTMPVLAESTGGTANTAVSGAMQTVANDMIATGNSVIPIALTVVGLAMVVVFGVRMFKKVAK